MTPLIDNDKYHVMSLFIANFYQGNLDNYKVMSFNEDTYRIIFLRTNVNDLHGHLDWDIL